MGEAGGDLEAALGVEPEGEGLDGFPGELAEDSMGASFHGERGWSLVCPG